MNHNVKYLKEMEYHVQERMLVKIGDVLMFLILPIKVHVLIIYQHVDLMVQLVLTLKVHVLDIQILIIKFVNK